MTVTVTRLWLLEEISTMSFETVAGKNFGKISEFGGDNLGELRLGERKALTNYNELLLFFVNENTPLKPLINHSFRCDL